MSEEPSPVEEPYLGRESVYHLDRMIVVAMELSEAVAHWTRDNELSRLQGAACQLIPHGFSIALSIRELIRTGYLLSAEILVRPLIERAAVISYLTKSKEDVVSLWEQGWPYKSRPQLKQLMATMTEAPEEDVDLENEKVIIEHFNRLIHADPLGSSRNVGSTAEGLSGFLSGPNFSSPEICDETCLVTISCLVVLHARATQLFPEAHIEGNIQDAHQIAKYLAAQRPE